MVGSGVDVGAAVIYGVGVAVMVGMATVVGLGVALGVLVGGWATTTVIPGVGLGDFCLSVCCSSEGRGGRYGTSRACPGWIMLGLLMSFSMAR